MSEGEKKREKSKEEKIDNRTYESARLRPSTVSPTGPAAWAPTTRLVGNSEKTYT